MFMKKLALPVATLMLGVVAGSADAAGTGPKYIGGGATLPAIAYVGVTPATTTNPGSPASGSALAYWLANLTSTPASSLATYCQTGSGFGKKVLNGTDDASLTCAALGTTSVDGTNGFAAPTGQKYPDFVGSDAPLSVAEYNTFVTNAGTSGSKNFGRGEPVAVPSIVGSVAIVYNNSDTSLPATLDLSNAQICHIFDGETTNWTSLGATTSKTIKVIYRSDGSGTTFSFANHLSSVSGGLRNVCTGTGETYALDQTFTNVLPSPLPTGATIANFTGASGNPGVIAAVAANDGTIGYAETANVLAYNAAHPTAQLKYATIGGSDPVKNLPEAAYALTTSTTLVKDKAVGTFVANGRPGLTALSPSVAGCVVVADPDKYSSPSGYPIVAVTNLMFSSKGNSSTFSGNSAVVTDLQNLGYFLSQSGTYPSVTTIDQATNVVGTGTKGFSSFRLGAATTLPATIKTAATGCIGS